MKDSYVKENKSFINNSFSFLLQPLNKFRKIHERGDELYQYLFYDRDMEMKRIINAIDEISNIIIVGNPGQGKSCLMHYLFIDFSKKNDTFPIILDWREIMPKSVKGIITKFVEEIRKYFLDINQQCYDLKEGTTIENSEEQMRIVTKHMQEINKNQLTKRLVIFIDDLDYAENDYMTILKKYFLNYASSDKAIVILSCRRPLLNNIRCDDELRQCYHIQPHHIDLNNIDLGFLLHHRVRLLIKGTSRNKGLKSYINSFRQRKLDKLLIKIAKEKKLKLDSTNISNGLPFNDSFYAKLYDITYGNLRDIEELIPKFYEYEIKNPNPSFKDDFFHVFIKNTASNASSILLNFTKEKTRGTNKRKKNNAILQNILEYFYFNEVKDDYFYEAMNNLGITGKEADEAINILIEPPYNVIDPKFVYCLNSHKTIHKRYLINNKGRIYVKNILRNDYYYQYTQESKSNRSYYNEHCKELE